MLRFQSGGLVGPSPCSGISMQLNSKQGDIAQMGERSVRNAEVSGSTPDVSIFPAGNAGHFMGLQ